MEKAQKTEYAKTLMKYFADLTDEQLEIAETALIVVRCKRRRRPITQLGVRGNTGERG